MNNPNANVQKITQLITQSGAKYSYMLQLLVKKSFKIFIQF